jgi:hypothetical protein
VTIQADDVIQGPGGDPSFDEPFTSGKCGFLSFSRNGNTGVTDVTIDNYFAAAADPNTATAPAHIHPIAGTPIVDTRNPAERFKNFLNPANGISFTAKTYTTDVINAAATKLFLNGQDLSSQLVLSANGTGITGSLPGSALTANKVYSASIVVQDVSGAKKSTNSFFFDTFSDAYLLSAGVKTIEAEDFNIDGTFLSEPIPVSGYTAAGEPVNLGTGYLETGGSEGVDFHDLRTSPENPWGAEYRSSTPVGLSAGLYPEIEDLVEPVGTVVRRSDNVRSQFAASNLLEVVVHRTQVGEWLNYTRVFTDASYTPYLRVATFGATTVELHRVTSDPTQPDQTTEKLGAFNVPNTLQRFNYIYVPLVNDAGQPVTLDLTGTNTLRLLMAGVDGQDERKLAINYMLFVPAPAEAVTFSAPTQTDTTITLNWTGGTGKFLVQKKTDITSPTWTNVLTTTQRTATLPKTGSAGFFRIQDNYTGPDINP